MMPTLFGEPFYPGGAPLSHRSITVFGKTVMEMFLLHSEGKATDKEQDILKEYVIYFINAPLFMLPDELKNRDISEVNLDDLIEECLDQGIDPF